jgi:tight adherence protein B
MTGRLWLVLVTCFLALTVLLVLVGYLVSRRDSRAARLQRLVGRYGAAGAGAAVVQPHTDAALADRSPVLGAVFGVAGRIAARESVGTRLAGMLQRADLRLTPTEWLVIELSVATLSGAATGLVLHHVLVGGVIGAVLGLAATHGWLMFLAARRTRAFSDRLPDALQLLASGVASGFGLTQALEAVAQGGPQPVADELAKAMVDVRLGLPMTDALDRVALRMRSPDLELTVMSIAIQGEVGGNLAEVLRGIVATMRERAYLRRQIRTLSAEGRLSSYILIALPIAMLGYLLLARRDYVRPLYTEPVGLVMSAAATLCLLIGVVVMHKMVKVDV